MFCRGIVEEFGVVFKGGQRMLKRQKGSYLGRKFRNTQLRCWTGGFQWRHFGAEYTDCHTDYTDYTGQGVDQLGKIIHWLLTSPTSRRLVLSGWCPSQQKQ